MMIELKKFTIKLRFIFFFYLVLNFPQTRKIIRIRLLHSFNFDMQFSQLNFLPHVLTNTILLVFCLLFFQYLSWYFLCYFRHLNSFHDFYIPCHAKPLYPRNLPHDLNFILSVTFYVVFLLQYPNE